VCAGGRGGGRGGYQGHYHTGPPEEVVGKYLLLQLSPVSLQTFSSLIDSVVVILALLFGSLTWQKNSVTVCPVDSIWPHFGSNLAESERQYCQNCSLL